MHNTENKIISIAIYSIWGLLIIFGILTLIQPKWLVEISDPGKEVEAKHISNIGDNFLKNKEYNKAINSYINALKIVPDLKSAIANLGIAYQESGQYNKAIIVFDQLLKMNPEYPGLIYFQLANIYEKTGKPNIALKYYILSAEISANPESAFQKAGHIYMENNKLDSAIICFHKAAENKRDLENAYKSMLITQKQSISDTTNEYKIISEQLKSGTYKNSLSVYDETIFNYVLSNDNNLAKTYNNLGYCYALQKKYNESLKYLKIAIKIDPLFKDAKNNLKAIETLIKNNSD